MTIGTNHNTLLTRAAEIRVVLASIDLASWTVGDIGTVYSKVTERKPPPNRLIRSYLQLFLENGEIERVERGRYRNAGPLAVIADTTSAGG